MVFGKETVRHLAVRLSVALSVAGTIVPATAADKQAAGSIKGFECGDNCYLTIETDKNEELTGLCLADACSKWNEDAAMPDDMIGRRVQVTIGTGQQVDGSDNVMGDFPAFTTIVFVEN